MKVKYDDRVIEVTPRYVAALEEVLRAELAMFQTIEPEYSAECWVWGKATIKDLGYFNGVTFEFGGEDDRPEGLIGDVQVVSEIE